MKLPLQKSPQIFDSRPELPSQFFTREGVKVEITGDRWVLPLLYRHSRLDFSRVENDTLKTSIKNCIIDQASMVSTHARCQYWSDLSATIVSRQKKHSLFPSISAVEFEERLIALMEEAINQARNKHRLWALYRPIQWYICLPILKPHRSFGRLIKRYRHPSGSNGVMHKEFAISLLFI